LTFTGSFGVYLEYIKVFYVEDISFKANSIEIFGVRKLKDPDDELIDINADLDTMPDCLLKYKTIIKRAQELNEKFIDK